MKNTIVKFALSLVTLAGLVLPNLATAQNCSTWASNIIKQYESAQNYLGARITTNRSDGKYVSYAATVTGQSLIYVPAHRSGTVEIPASLQGKMPQFFSDRTFEFNGNLEPFNPAATDSLGVTIWLGFGGLYSPTLGYAITPAEVSFTLYSWGDAIATFTPERCDGMIYGLSGNTGMLLSLFPTSAPIQ